MTKRKKANGVTPAARAAILGCSVGVIALFFGVAFGTERLMDIAPILLIPIVIILMAVYTAMTANLLYEYFEVSPPITRFIPCYGELTLMDSKFRRIGTVFYIIAIVALGVSQLPYSVVGRVGNGALLNLPIYAMLLALVALLIIQVIKGIGLLDCEKSISEEWEEHVGGSVGIIKTMSLLGFIPFVRVAALFALNKSLSTMVTFNNITASTDEETELEEEDEESSYGDI